MGDKSNLEDTPGEKDPKLKKLPKSSPLSGRLTKIDPALTLLEGLLDIADKQDASALHIYLSNRSNNCYLEISGRLQTTVKKLNNTVVDELAEYLKRSANLERSSLSTSQTATLKINNSTPLTLSLINSPEYGTSHLILFLTSSVKSRSFDDLGFWGKNLGQLEQALDVRQGIILLDSTDQFSLRSTIHSALNYLNQHQQAPSITFDSSVLPDINIKTNDRIFTSINASSLGVAKSVLSSNPAVITFLGNINKTVVNLAVEQAALGKLVFICSSEGSASYALKKLLTLVPDLLDNLIQGLRLVTSISPIQTIASSNGSHPLTSETISQIENFFELELPESWKSICLHAGIKSPEQLLDLHLPVASEYAGVTNLIEVFKPTDDLKRILLRNPHLTAQTITSLAIRSGMLTKKEDGLIKSLRKEVDLADVIDICK